MRALSPLLAALLTLGLAACSGKDDDSGSTGGTAAADLAGNWTGDLTGTISISDETDPACEGNVTATIDNEGNVSGTGTCQGVSADTGSVFVIAFTGVVGDGSASMDVTFDGSAWADATVTGGTTPNRIEASGATTYTPNNREPVDATLTLVLER